MAGNFANTDTIASLEYAVAVLGAPLILVLGHDSCGGVEATIKSLKDDKALPGHMPSLVEGIAPSVKAVSEQGGDALGKAIRQNAVDTAARLKFRDPDPERGGQRGTNSAMVGGIYRLKDGRVDMVG